MATNNAEKKQFDTQLGNLYDTIAPQLSPPDRAKLAGDINRARSGEVDFSKITAIRIKWSKGR